MQPNWNDIRGAEEHRQDLLREAARRRFAHEASALAPAATPPRRLHTRALARLGRWLVLWGSRLEALDATSG